MLRGLMSALYLLFEVRANLADEEALRLLEEYEERLKTAGFGSYVIPEGVNGIEHLYLTFGKVTSNLMGEISAKLSSTKDSEASNRIFLQYNEHLVSAGFGSHYSDARYETIEKTMLPPKVMTGIAESLSGSSDAPTEGMNVASSATTEGSSKITSQEVSVTTQEDPAASSVLTTPQVAPQMTLTKTSNKALEARHQASMVRVGFLTAANLLSTLEMGQASDDDLWLLAHYEERLLLSFGAGIKSVEHIENSQWPPPTLGVVTNDFLQDLAEKLASIVDSESRILVLDQYDKKLQLAGYSDHYNSVGIEVLRKELEEDFKIATEEASPIGTTEDLKELAEMKTKPEAVMVPEVSEITTNVKNEIASVFSDEESETGSEASTVKYMDVKAEEEDANEVTDQTISDVEYHDALDSLSPSACGDVSLEISETLNEDDNAFVYEACAVNARLTADIVGDVEYKETDKIAPVEQSCNIDDDKIAPMINQPKPDLVDRSTTPKNIDEDTNNVPNAHSSSVIDVDASEESDQLGELLRVKNLNLEDFRVIRNELKSKNVPAVRETNRVEANADLVVAKDANEPVHENAQEIAEKNTSTLAGRDVREVTDEAAIASVQKPVDTSPFFFSGVKESTWKLLKLDPPPPPIRVTRGPEDKHVKDPRVTYVAPKVPIEDRVKRVAHRRLPEPTPVDWFSSDVPPPSDFYYHGIYSEFPLICKAAGFSERVKNIKAQLTRATAFQAGLLNREYHDVVAAFDKHLIALRAERPVNKPRRRLQPHQEEWRRQIMIWLFIRRHRVPGGFCYNRPDFSHPLTIKASTIADRMKWIETRLAAANPEQALLLIKEFKLVVAAINQPYDYPIPGEVPPDDSLPPELEELRVRRNRAMKECKNWPSPENKMIQKELMNEYKYRLAIYLKEQGHT